MIEVEEDIGVGLTARASDRFGKSSNILIKEAKSTAIRVSKSMGVKIGGWAADAARSVVAVAGGGEYIIKAPLTDAASAVKAIELYGHKGIGPKVFITEYGKHSSAVVMEVVGGRFYTERMPSLDDTVSIIKSAHGIPAFEGLMTLTGRTVQELSEAILRSQNFRDGARMDRVLRASDRVLDLLHEDLVVCHGDLDVRNILTKDGEPCIVDPEPLLSPPEWDLAKFSHYNGVSLESLVRRFDANLPLAESIYELIDSCRVIYEASRKATKLGV